MKVCFINLPLVTKEELTINEIDFYEVYWNRMDAILGKNITAFRFSQGGNFQPAYDIQELPIWIAALSPLIEGAAEILMVDMELTWGRTKQVIVTYC